MARSRSPLYSPSSLREADDVESEFERAAAEFEAEEEGVGYAPSSPIPTITVEQSVEYLNQTLPGFGIMNPVRLGDLGSDEAASICNVLHTLIHQRQKEQDYRRASEEQLSRLRSDIHSLEQNKERLSNKLQAQERENGSWLVKERQIKQAHSQALQKVTDERDSLSKTITGLQRKYVQMQHEVKRKELDLQKVSERLTDLLADKKKADAKAGVELERALNRSSAPSLSPSVSPQHPPGRSPKIDGDMFKMVVGAYEAKQKEMQEENKDLKASMAALQAEHRDLVNARSTYTPPSAVADILRHSNSASAQTISAKFQALNKKVTQIMKANQGTAQQVHTGLEKQLQDQVGSLSQCLSEMETLTGSVVLSMENSNQQMMEVEKEVNNLTEEIDRVRKARNESQHNLELVVRDREGLALMLKQEKAAHAEVQDALQLVKQSYEELHRELANAKDKLAARAAATKEVTGNMSSLRKQHKQLDQDRLEVYEARSEVDMARQEFNRLQAKLNEGFEDLHAKRSEVLKDIEKENARLARSWEQVKAARKEIEDHQAKLIKTWEQIEAAKIETGMAVTPRPALQRISLQGSSFARPTKEDAASKPEETTKQAEAQPASKLLGARPSNPRPSAIPPPRPSAPARESFDPLSRNRKTGIKVPNGSSLPGGHAKGTITPRAATTSA